LSDKRPSKVDAADGELANEFYGTFYLAKDKKNSAMITKAHFQRPLNSQKKVNKNDK
jgi:hypothetical protein